jgi:hypothetical protein
MNCRNAIRNSKAGRRYERASRKYRICVHLEESAGMDTARTKGIIRE